MAYIIAVVIALVIVGAWAIYFFRALMPNKLKSIEAQARQQAEQEAEVIKQKKLLEVKEKFLNKKAELEKEVQQRNQQIQQGENRVKQREQSLNQRQDELNRRKQEIEATRQRLETQQNLLEHREHELQERSESLLEQERTRLEEISGLSVDEARERLVESLKDEAKTQAQAYINDIMDEAKMPNALSFRPFSVWLRKRPLKIVSPCSTSRTMTSRVA